MVTVLWLAALAARAAALAAVRINGSCCCCCCGASIEAAWLLLLLLVVVVTAPLRLVLSDLLLGVPAAALTFALAAARVPPTVLWLLLLGALLCMAVAAA
jgi:hypothetical protein